jgi:sugar phosphate isomerase/epimerase
MAETAGITLGIEPEVGNVVDSAQRAHRLVQEMRSPRLGIIMDGANLFKAGSLPRMREILTEAFDLLGNRIVLAHAKDLSGDGHAGQEAAGTGLLDYELYLRLLHQADYTGPLILHSLTEAQVPASIAFLKQKLATANSDPCPSSTTTN